MKRLFNRTKRKEVATHLDQALTTWTRMRGLLGTRELPSGHALWIHGCNSIHTCFMSYPIDAVFLDDGLVVKHIRSSVEPWRMILPLSGVSSVVELPAGSVQSHNIEIGDEFYVGA